ncbi:hypothetical protein QKW35_11880 [Pontibacterium granulatum]|uniref:hypothetical protein n=1 Tax=Pontibacterium granulatum TaxID=2036029 RepID=UPI00249BD8EC|nr:hypothetical protein [Pontibacterium granulatum]MDI3325079.1 hypothetical protein [Pontibacterium granulatum]
MQIKTVSELSRFSSSLLSTLKKKGVGIKLHSLRYHLAVAWGFNTYNGLRFSFPNQCDINPLFVQNLSVRLKSHRNYTLSNAQLAEACRQAYPSSRKFIVYFESTEYSKLKSKFYVFLQAIGRVERKQENHNWRNFKTEFCYKTGCETKKALRFNSLLESLQSAIGGSEQEVMNITWRNLIKEYRRKS